MRVIVSEISERAVSCSVVSSSLCALIICVPWRFASTPSGGDSRLTSHSEHRQAITANRSCSSTTSKETTSPASSCTSSSRRSAFSSTVGSANTAGHRLVENSKTSTTAVCCRRHQPMALRVSGVFQIHPSRGFKLFKKPCRQASPWAMHWVEPSCIEIATHDDGAWATENRPPLKHRLWC